MSDLIAGRPPGAPLAVPVGRGRLALPPLPAFLLRRLAVAVVLAVAVSLLVFIAIQLLPGDPARAALGGRATPAQLAAVRAELGLDQPAPQRYLDWLSGLAHGDLGTSLLTHQRIAHEIAGPLLNTIVLALVTLAIILPLGVALGTLAGLRRGLADQLISGVTLAAIGIPEFVIGSVLILVVAIHLGWVPPVSLIAPHQTGLDHPSVLVLPVATLVLVGLAYTVRMVRAMVIEVIGAEYVQMARLAGVRERVIVRRYVLRNSMAGSVQVMAQTVQWLFGGVVVVETVFGYPGLGQELVSAVAARDLAEVQSLTFLIALTFIVINVFADLIVVLLVPKLRTAAV